jgi:hypothetical protein
MWGFSPLSNVWKFVGFSRCGETQQVARAYVRHMDTVKEIARDRSAVELNVLVAHAIGHGAPLQQQHVC